MNQKAKLIKYMQLSVLATAFVALPAMAQSSPNVMPPGTYTFSGESKLTDTATGTTVTCQLTLTGEATNKTAPNPGVYIDIQSGSVDPGQIACLGVSLSGFTPTQTGTPSSPGAWEAFKSDSAIASDISSNPLGPINFTVQNITVSAPFTTCSGDVDASFFNGQSAMSDPSFFTFNDQVGSSNCHVMTTQPTGIEVQGGTDPNVQ